MKTGTRLAPIVEDVRRRLAERRRALPLEELRRRVRSDPAHGERFLAALRAPGLQLIAECKRASPSAGRLSGETDWIARTRTYA